MAKSKASENLTRIQVTVLLFNPKSREIKTGLDEVRIGVKNPQAANDT